MKHTKPIAILLMNILLVLSGCSGNCGREKTKMTDTEITQASAITEVVAVSSAAKTDETDITAIAATSQATETTPEIASSDDRIEYPAKLYIEDFISPKLADKAESIKQTREKFSETNKFYDFEFISELAETDIPDDVKARAEALAADEQAYNDANEKAYNEAAEHIYNMAQEYKGLPGNDWVAYDKFKAGEASPEFIKAYEYDFDGEQGNERFIIVSVPEITGEGQEITASMLLFENSRGDMSIIGFVDTLRTAAIIDYGEFRQFVFGGYGPYGYREHTAVYGVISGNPKKLIDDRINFDTPKRGCFLYHGGWQGFSELMIYDTEIAEYRTIYGYPADTKKLRELDVDHDIEDIHSGKHDEYTAYYVVGEKYLIGRGGMGCYTYENGRFTTGCPIACLYQIGLDDNTDIEWFDVDIDHAFEACSKLF